MRAVILVILLGLGVGLLGIVEANLYVVGLLILFVGVIGAAVQAGDWLICYLRQRGS